MAYYAALVSLVQLLEDIVHHDRYQSLLLDMQEKCASVYGKFSLLQMLLDDYSPKDREEGADSLERRIRNAAYQAQDIIESHISNQVHRKDKTAGVKRVLRHLMSPLQKVLGNQGLEKVKKQVDSIVEELLRIKTSQTTEDLPLNYYSIDAGTSKQAPSRTNTMAGVEEHSMMIKDQLCGESPKLQVVSIVGMGGIGKTTLARNIFYDELIVQRFDCHAWVTISQDYHLKKVLLDIWDSLKVIPDRSNAVGELRDKIYKHLKGRRYLIIMDDMWETKVWDDLKWILPDDCNGSRIMITTRKSDVASYAGNFRFFHQMQFLNVDQSWNLFHKKVFCPPELEDIGRLIAKNCCGLPLAIVVVAGLLSKVNKKRSDWEEIARNVSRAVENDEHFSKIVSLSYNNLPHHLKPLFLYIGGFPEDYEIPASKLIKLWIAEGFLKPTESKSLEEVAEEYMEDLVKRNLVLITKKKFNGKTKYYGIHDVLRDLCRRIVCHENFLHVLNKDEYICPSAARNVHRIYIHPARSAFTKVGECGPHVRSIISLTHDGNFLSFGFGFRLLRVLDAVKLIFLLLPTEILELFHLRYLALSTPVLPLPPSISKLQNLQTLILGTSDGHGVSFSLPSQIWEMPNLRHIMVCHLELPLLSKEKIVGEPYILENLQTLSWVVNMKFTNEVIEMIPNLKELKVFYRDTCSVWQEFHLNNLLHLPQLKTLNICFSPWHRRYMNPFPESFAFPSTLNELSLEDCRIPWKDLKVVGSLPNLHVLKLRHNAFVGKEWVSIEGQFPQLRFLLMENLGIECWQAENTHFPNLKHLKIGCCDRLWEIPPEIGETLELVEVNSSYLAAMSAKEMQKEQQNMGNNLLRVRINPQYWNIREEETLKSEEEIEE